MTPMQLILMKLDPIVGCYVKSGSPCGDPMGIEYDAVPIRLSEVLHETPAQHSSQVRSELQRLGWYLTSPPASTDKETGR